MDKKASYKATIMKMAYEYTKNDFIDATIDSVDELPAFQEVEGSPFYEHKVKGKIRGLLENHPLVNKIVEDNNFNIARSAIKDPDSKREFWKRTGIGAGVGTAAGALAGIFTKRKLPLAVSGSVLGTGIGSALGQYKRNDMNEAFRDNLIGQKRDTYDDERTLDRIMDQEIEDIKDNDLTPAERVQLAYDRVRESNARAEAAERELRLRKYNL